MQDDGKKLIVKAIEFLESESTAPREHKIEFLKNKGLSPQEIESAFSSLAWKLPSTTNTKDYNEKPISNVISSQPPTEPITSLKTEEKPPSLPERPNESYSEHSLYPPRPSLIKRAILIALFGGSSLVAISSLIAKLLIPNYDAFILRYKTYAESIRSTISSYILKVSRLGREYTPTALPDLVSTTSIETRLEDLREKIKTLSSKYAEQDELKDVEEKVTLLHTLVTQEMYFAPTNAFAGWAAKENEVVFDARGRLVKVEKDVRAEIRGIKALCLNKRRFP